MNNEKDLQIKQEEVQAEETIENVELIEQIVEEIKTIENVEDKETAKESEDDGKKKLDIHINESLKDIEEKVKKSDIYTQLKQMFTKIKENDYEFTLTKRDQWIIIGIVMALIFFDQVTKIIASNLLMEYESYEIIDNFFYFTFLYNPGMAWGSFSGMRWLFVIITPIILLGVTYFFVYSKKHEVLTRAGMILVFGGAIGNWIDRLIIGEVRDFIHFIIPIINYDFPVFNIADIAVVMGMGLVILEIIIQEYQIWKLSKSL